jgi:predicted protein tyrosine phosphatase
MVTHALFVCSQNRLRSPTAEQVFSAFPELECQSAGTDPAANVPLDPELIEWADVIFVMERSHRNRVQKKFKVHLNGKRIVVLEYSRRSWRLAHCWLLHITRGLV